MAVLDTGAQFSSISQRMAERIGLAENAMATDRTVMAHGAAPDQVAVRIHRFREFRVGPAVMHAPALPVVPMSSGMGDALVGADFLQGRRVWLSFSTQRVFVTPLERGPWIAVTRTGERARPGQPICTDCTASSNSRNVGMCSLGTILRPDSTLTCGALPCRWVTRTARITS